MTQLHLGVKLRQFSAAYDAAMRRFFYRVAYFVAQRPKAVIAVTLSLASLLTLAILMQVQQLNPDKLFTPQDSVAQQDRAFLREVRWQRLASSTGSTSWRPHWRMFGPVNTRCFRRPKASPSTRFTRLASPPAQTCQCWISPP